MARNIETLQGLENYQTENKIQSSISRRKFLLKTLGVGLTLALVADACSAPAGTQSSTPKPSEYTPLPSPTLLASGETSTPTPEATPKIDEITPNTFINVLSRLNGDSKISVSQKGKKITKTVDELSSITSYNWNEKTTSATISRNSIKALKFALSSAELSEHIGIIDMSKIFPELELKLSRFVLDTLPNDKNTEATINIQPQNLTLRKNMNMIILGIDSSNKNVVIAFSDSVRKTDGEATMYLGILPVSIKSKKEGDTSFEEILGKNGASYDAKSQSILYENGEILSLHQINSTFMQKIKAEAGSYFIDINPLETKVQNKIVLETNPIIPVPDSKIIPKINKIEQADDGRILALDSSGKPVARAADFGNWQWITEKVFVNDYAIREYADAEKIAFSLFVDKSLFANPEYSSITKALGNEIVIAAELDPNRVFKNFSEDTLKNIVTNWSKISASLNKGVIPDGFNFNWKDADTVINFAQNNHINIVAQHLFWSGDSASFPDAMSNGNFSAADLSKILEFMVKTRVLHYKGIIKEWEGASEVSAYLTYAQPSYLVKKLGIGVIDDVFRWAHEADPDAKLRFTEDHILETDDPSLLVGFWNLLNHFLEKNVPVDIVAPENNMWIYTPPNKQNMIEVLNRIKSMGFEIGTPETTVVTSDIFPIWPTRTKTVTSIKDRFSAQAKIYSDIANAYIETDTKVFGLGGFTDADEWYKALAPYDTEAMIFDKNYEPKPAYFSLLEIFKKQLSS